MASLIEDLTATLRTPIPCWRIWGVNATWRCVLERWHDGNCQYVYIGREARHWSDGSAVASVTDG
jgi:hypothetical protein